MIFLEEIYQQIKLKGVEIFKRPKGLQKEKKKNERPQFQDLTKENTYACPNDVNVEKEKNFNKLESMMAHFINEMNQLIVNLIEEKEFNPFKFRDYFFIICYICNN